MTRCVNMQVIFEEAAECSLSFFNPSTPHPTSLYICETHVPSSTVCTESALSAPRVFREAPGVPPENKPLLTKPGIQLLGRGFFKKKGKNKFKPGS